MSTLAPNSDRAYQWLETNNQERQTLHNNNSDNNEQLLIASDPNNIINLVPPNSSDLEHLRGSSPTSDKYTINRERVHSEFTIIAESTSDDTESSGHAFYHENPQCEEDIDLEDFMLGK